MAKLGKNRARESKYVRKYLPTLVVGPLVEQNPNETRGRKPSEAKYVPIYLPTFVEHVSEARYVRIYLPTFVGHVVTIIYLVYVGLSTKIDRQICSLFYEA